jgi:hypothetical protein
MTGAPAAWLQPALLAGLALRVAAGEPDAPWLALAALIAPLVALLQPVRRPAKPEAVTGVAAAAVAALLLAANFLMAADAAMLVGGAAWQGVGLASALALLVPLAPAARQLGPPAVTLGAVALALSLGAVALTTGIAPWTAWSHSGLRPALTFSEASAWVQEGERFARASRLTFVEGQRVTALSAGVYRVVERDATPPTVRDWRLASGETLTLRPGDELTVAAGARLRFEAGRRVPGAPVSGAAWADARARGPWMLPAALGATVTLVGGALALVPAATRRGAVGPLWLLAGVSVATAWGVYAAAAAPDLALGGSLPAPWLRLPPLMLGAPSGGTLALVAAAGLVLLFLSATVTLRQRLVAVARPPRAAWVAAVALGAALTASPLDPWRLVTLGLGLAAASWTPALLASGHAGRLAGSVAGGTAFLVVAALPWLAAAPAPWLENLARYPALIALPLGWAAAAAASPGGARREGHRDAA